MNRLVTTNPSDITPDLLPPQRRGPGEPARILFSHTSHFGFATTSRTLIDYAAARADIDAVHITLPLSPMQRLVGKELPKFIHGWDFHNTRMTMAFGRAIERALRPGGPIPLDRFDVVHLMTRESASVVLRPWARRPGGVGPKFIINVDTTLKSWDRAYQITRWAPALDHHTDAKVLRAADAVAFASDWALQSGLHDYGLDPARVILHKPCVRVTLGAPRMPLAPGQLHRIVFIGNDWERKGGPRLLAWHQQRWSDRAELHVCSARAPANSALKNVVWHGAVPHDKLIADILPKMTLCVIPTFEDTFLIAAQEAQAAGLPVVTTRLAGIPEVVAHGVSGLLIDRHDDAGFIAAVESLLDDPALAARMSSAAIEHVRVNLNADIWHNHLLNQLVNLANNQPLHRTPA